MSTTKPRYHSFLVDEASQYGIEAAILLNHFRFWLDKNLADEKHIKDGYVWMYSSGEALAKLFPYMNQRSIARYLDTLCKAGVLMRANYNKTTYDRTLWYTIPEEFSIKSTISQNDKWIGQNDESIRQNDISIGQNDESIRQNGEPIPITRTDTDTLTTTTTTASSVVGGGDLIFSKVFSKAEREKMAKILEAVAEIDVKQQMLDVLTAAVQDGKVKNKLSYLRGLAKSHANGLFDPLPGFYVAQRRADALAGSQAAGFTDQRQVAELESELKGLIRINNQGLLDGQIASKRQKLAELKASRPV